MQEKIWALIGLGNPGKEYKSTRHNIGYMAIDEIASECEIRISLRRLRSVIGEGEYDGGKLILCKPRTYMNLSGLAVKALLSRYRLKPANLLVVSDDFNLPLGTIRIKSRGSSGGHKGLASIINEIGTEEFPRLRIGIGPVPENTDPMNFVLGEFTSQESGSLRHILEDAKEALLLCFKNGIEGAMNRYNSKMSAV